METTNAKILAAIAVIATAVVILIGFGAHARAISTFAVQQGGTGTTTAPTGQLFYGGNSSLTPDGKAFQSVGTTTVSCGTGTTCTQFVVIGSTPITITSTASGNFLSTSSPWTGSGVAYRVSNSAVSTAATTSLSFTGPFTITNPIGVINNGAVVYYGLATTSNLSQGQILYNTTGGNGVASAATATPSGVDLLISGTGATIGALSIQNPYAISTTSGLSVSQLSYFTQVGGRTTLGGVATNTASCSGSVSCSAFTVISGSPITITGSGSGSGLSTTSPVSGGNLLWYNQTGAGSATGVATTTYTVSGPFTNSGTAIIVGATPITSTYWGLATTTNIVSGNLLVGTASNGVYNIATGTLSTGTTGLTLSGTPTLVNGGSTLAGVLAIANGGTNDGGFTTNQLVFFNGTSLVSASSSQITNSGAYMGLGTSTPQWLLQLASSTKPQLTLSDGSLTNAPFNFRANGPMFTLSTSSPTTFATTSSSFAQFNSLTGSTTLQRLDITGTATSSFGGGVNLTSGCFAINNVCVGGGSGTNFFTNSGNFTSLSTGIFLGVGTTTPQFPFMGASATKAQLVLSDTSLTSSQWGFRNLNGNLYIATSSPTTFGTSTTQTASSTFVMNGTSAYIGFGTSSPTFKISIESASTSVGTATSTDSLWIGGWINTTRYAWLRFDQYGHRITGGPAPSNDCGATILGDDTNGVVNSGGITGCVITFAKNYPAGTNQVCNVTNGTDNNGVLRITAATNVSFTVNTGTAWTTFYYHCEAHSPYNGL